MKNTKIHILGFLLLSFLISPFVVSGDASGELDEIQRIEQNFERYKQELEKQFQQRNREGRQGISEIRQKMKSELISFDLSQKLEKEAREKIAGLEKEITTLSGQMKALEFSLEMTEKEIEVVKIRILRRVADIRFLTEELDYISAQKEVQQNTVLAFFALLQKENDDFGVGNEGKVLLRTLLSEESFSRNFWEGQQLLAMESVGREIFHDLEKSQRDVEDVTSIIREENKKLSTLHDRKKTEEGRLSEQITAKQILRDQAEKSEEGFQELLEESRLQMEKSAVIIADLKDKQLFIQEKLDRIERKYQSDQSKALSQEDAPDFSVGEKFLQEEQKTFFSWPIDPAEGISAYYLDEGYEDIFHVSHYAIDIPTSQGTEIQAPALGYVYQITDNGMGYSSLILAHKNNIMTVYGHVSSFLVEEGDLVRPDDIIALTGGTPGTKGSGLMTTGAHLHFEIYENGEHQDPLAYLPLDDLPLPYIPNSYLVTE